MVELQKTEQAVLQKPDVIPDPPGVQLTFREAYMLLLMTVYADIYHLSLA